MVKLSLKVKITRLVMVLVTSALLVFGISAYMPLRGALALQEQMFMTGLHTAKVKSLQGMFSEIEVAINAIAASDFLRGSAGDKDGQASRFLKDQLAGHRNTLTRLMVVDGAGTVVAASERVMVGRRLGDVWRGNDLNEPFVLSSDAALLTPPFADKPTLVVSKPLELATGQGALVAYLNWSSLMDQHLFVGRSEDVERADPTLLVLMNSRGLVVGSSSRHMAERLFASGRTAERPSDLSLNLEGQGPPAGSLAKVTYDNRPYQAQRMEVTASLLGHEVSWSLLTARDEQVLHQNLNGFGVLLVLGGILVVFLCAVGAYMSSSRLSRDLLNMVPPFEQLAAGNLLVKVQCNTGDEVEMIAQHFNAFVEKLRVIVVNIVESIRTLSESSHLLADLSQNLVSNAQETSSQAGAASKISDEVSTNINTVSAGVEEMSLSINEIARSSDEAARVATSAVRIAEMTNTTVAELGGSSSEIGNVIKVINSIAEQTNLLALNATIEAARAGEAGKGFAVVANEVKELAKETARATEDIGQKIEAIQAKTKGAVNAIGEIGSIINQVNDYQTTIASAVQEQLATTTEIGRNIAEVAERSYMITKNISTVAQIAQNASTGATETQNATSEVARISSDLHRLVDNFRYNR